MREGWEYKKLGEVASVTDYVANGSFATLRENVHYLDTKGYAILIRYADYSNGFDPNKYVYIDEHAYNFLSKSKLYGGEIIMSNVGSIGKSFICPKLTMPMSLAPNSIVINTPNNRFYQYYFKSNSFQGLLKTISSKTALPKFNKTQFKGLVAPVPPLSEQQRIVEELDLLGSVIEKKKEQLKELDNLAQSIFYDMFGDPVTNEKGWEVNSMNEVCNGIGDGLHGTPQYDANGEIAFINGNNLIDGRIVITERTQFVNEDEAKKIYIELDTNTILLSINGTLGKTAVYNNENIVLGKSACYLRLKNRLNVQFVLALMKTNVFMDFLEKNSSQSTIKNVGLKAIRNYKIILPPLSLQQQFAEKIEAIEQQKELIKQSITEVETLFNSRMDYYFT